jgi:hypothetical protein
MRLLDPPASILLCAISSRSLVFKLHNLDLMPQMHLLAPSIQSQRMRLFRPYIHSRNYRIQSPLDAPMRRCLRTRSSLRVNASIPKHRTASNFPALICAGT